MPSSTIDEPDVPLLDHSLSVAAFATCLHAHHAERGELTNVPAIKDRQRPKFRLLRGDLSGIQASLFRLAAQQVKGVNRILRARSFLIGQLVEAAALLIRRELRLPPYVVLMRAGGQLTMLLPEVTGIEGRIAAIQGRIDRWMAGRYAGELALVLGLTQPLPGSAFQGERIDATLDLVRNATERAKERPLAGFLAENGPVLKIDYEERAEGACSTCGVRPATEGDGRCEACHHEHELGRRLPRLRQLLWLDGPGDGQALELFGEVRLRVVGADEATFEPRANVASAWKPWGSEAAWPVATRPLANHVPLFRENEWDDPRYRDIPKDEDDIVDLHAGGIKSMAYLGHAARDPATGAGRPMLAVLKADVDNLGQIFSTGLGDKRSIGRLMALSRSLDWFFTGRLPWLLRERFPDTYTVYAGGDDLLLIGPWHQTVALARALRDDFAACCGHNPSLTLSAGIELVSAREPLNRSADRAEDRLKAAKAITGKDRLALLDEELSWTDERSGLPWLLKWSDWLNERIREDEAGGTFVYKLLGLLDQRKKAEAGDTNAAIWRARYGYHMARKFPRPEQRPLWDRFNELMGLDRKAGTPEPPSRAAISMALWRNR